MLSVSFISKSVLINDCGAVKEPPAYLFVVADVLVGHAGEKLFEVLSLVALPALPVRLQVGVETLHLVLAFLHLRRHLRRNTDNYGYRGVQGTSYVV